MKKNDLKWYKNYSVEEFLRVKGAESGKKLPLGNTMVFSGEVLISKRLLSREGMTSTHKRISTFMSESNLF